MSMLLNINSVRKYQTTKVFIYLCVVQLCFKQNEMASEIKRSANFNSKEESILLCLVKKYKTILENKKTDTINNKQKLECWKRIETAFNSESGEVFRDSITLRKKYENLKKRTKKRVADERCYVLGTGGGPAKKPSEITDIDIEIKEILGERINGLPSEFSGDAETITIVTEPADNSSGDLTNTAHGIFENNYMLPVEETTDILPVDETTYMLSVEEAMDQTKDVTYSKFDSENDVENTKPKLDWSKNSVQNLRTPTSKALTSGDATRNKRTRNEYEALCSKVSHWAASKANLENDKSRLAMEEHNIKINLLQQKFERECEHMKKESEARIKKIEREMEVSVEGIIEQNKLKRDILLLEKHVMLRKLNNSNS